MVKIILDTNFLLIPGQFGVDVFSEIDRLVVQRHELCVIDKTVDELGHISKTAQTGADKRSAMLGLSIIERKAIEVVPTGEGHPDTLIVGMSEPGKTIVATQDQALKRMLKDKGIQVLTMRKKEFLILVEP